MNQKLKQALSDAFYAPKPVRKVAFLKQHRRRELGRWELIALQIRYIQWWVWGLSLALFAFILMTAIWTVESNPWYAAAMTPFLAVLVITENGRSQLHHMEELELACRISRQSVMLARMVVLGLFHLILLGALIPVLAVLDTMGVVQASVYLLTPYLLTAVLGLELTRRIRGRVGLLACGASGALVSVLGATAANMRPSLYQQSYLPLWIVVLATASVAAAVEFILSIKKMEEFQWI